MSLPSPSADAIRTGETQFIESEAVLAHHYPELWQQMRAWGVAQLAAIPLIIDARPFGALAFDWSKAKTLDEDDWTFASALARQGAQALERARLYRETELAAKRAEEASRAKDEFLSVISHELRTPLNAMQGWAHLMLSTKKDNPAVVDRGLEVIMRNARAQATIIDDILDMARVITGKLRLALQPTDVADLIDAVVESVRPSASAKGIEIGVESERRVMVLADADRIQQVLWNLISNSIKFTPEAGTVRVLLERQGNSVHIAVTDSGIGIAKKDLPHLFEPFRQVDSSKTRAKGGLGLGLALVRQLVQAHGGQVRAESAGVGHGAAFHVELPSHAAQLQGVPQRPSTAPPVPARARDDLGSNLNGVRVLVVDDEPDAAEVLQLTLQARGADVLVAHSAGEAFELATSALPQVLVSDIAMPGEDGYALLERLRARPSTAALPAIALTAYARPDDVEQAIRVGYRYHLAKPAEPEVVARLVAELAGDPPG
ncbi:MAG TPA: ATP-binding protein, partial [Polyangiaceae bacterium]|nr:ATP-binding protein [Polyangiaceae bacterium]